jgi:hypothetical protein
LNAIVAVVRKLAVALHRLWIDGTEFAIGKGAVVLEKRLLKGTIPE